MAIGSEQHESESNRADEFNVSPVRVVHVDWQPVSAVHLEQSVVELVEIELHLVATAVVTAADVAIGQSRWLIDMTRLDGQVEALVEEMHGKLAHVNVHDEITNFFA